MMMCVCNLSYSEDINQRIRVQACLGKKRELTQKITKAKRYGRCGSSGRSPDLAVEGPEFKPQYCQSERERERENPIA
jgi:hypothetical protein